MILNFMENQQRKFNQTKIWFFKKTNKIYKPLAKLTKKKRKTQITNIRDEKGDITTDLLDIKI